MGLFNFGNDIGIDLGTASILIYVKGKGVVLNEPSVVAMEEKTGNIIAIGEEARRMLGRTPGNIVAVRPLKDGVIADYDTTEKMLRYFIERASGHSWFFKPNVMICIPSGVTGVEERAVRQAAIQAGARQTYLMEEPLAAALGAGLEIDSAGGSMIIDIGGGTTDIAVMSLGGIVCSKSLRVGGDKFDEAIVRYARKEHNLLIGERFAESLKVEIGTAYPKALRDNPSMKVRGRDLVSGLPISVGFTARETYEAMLEPIETIVAGVKETLEITPPELAADIIDRGMIMTGGGSLLNGLDRLLMEETGLPVHVAEEPISCVVRGTALALTNIEYLQNAQGFRKKSLF